MATAVRWTAGENALKANLSSPTDPAATSKAPGIMGVDICQTIDLAPARPNCSLIVGGDAFWATAAGVAKPNFTLVHSVVALQTGRDLSTATLSWHSGGTPTAPLPFFPPVARGGAAFYKYPIAGVLLDDVLVVVHMLARSKAEAPNNFGTTMSGASATLLYGVGSGTPDTWPQLEVPVDLGAGQGSFHDTLQFGFAGNLIDGGDGWVYAHLFGPSGSDRWARCRFPRAEVKAGRIRDPEWWTPTGWTRDRRDRDSGIRVRRRGNPLSFSIEGGDQVGGVHKRPDGKWQATLIPHDWFDTAPDVGFALAASIDAPFGAYSSVYTPPMSVAQDFVYGAYSLPEQTWAGKGATDQLWIYSRNNTTPGYVFVDARAYWPELLKVTGA